MKNKHTHSIANFDNPKGVLQKLRNWLDDECWTHFEDTDAGRPILVTMAGGQHPLLPVLIHFCKGFHTIFFMAMLSVAIPKTRLPQVLEFIDMANEAEKMAPLGLSLRNNEVCAVTRVSLTTAELTDIEIKAAFEDAVYSIDAATPQLLSIAFGTKSPADAIDEMHEYDRLVQFDLEDLQTPEPECHSIH